MDDAITRAGKLLYGAEGPKCPVCGTLGEIDCTVQHDGAVQRQVADEADRYRLRLICPNCAGRWKIYILIRYAWSPSERRSLAQRLYGTGELTEDGKEHTRRPKTVDDDNKR